MNIWSVDRIENGFARCEGADRSGRLIPLAQLPPGVREGDCLRETTAGFLVDEEETKRRRSANHRLLQKLLKPGEP